MEILMLDGTRGDDLRPVDAFLLKAVREARGCLPPPMLDAYCVAQAGGRIVACCGTSFARDGRLHLEAIYRGAMPVIADRERACEIGRWLSVEPRAAAAVLRGLIGHLLGNGIEVALCELKAPAARRAGMLGLRFSPVQATLDIGAVDPAERGYYREDPPRLYRLELRGIRWEG